MKIFVGIQARLSSTRLPGKSLIKIKEKTLLCYLLERLKKNIPCENIFILTSDLESDSRIVKYCKKKKINFFLGSLTNVLNRYYEFSNYYNLDAVVRISGDSPMIDSNLITQMIKEFKKQSDLNLLTNTFPRTFPSGQSVEIISFKTLKQLNFLNLRQYYTEHVTNYIYENSSKFNIRNISCDYEHYSTKLSIDNEVDLENFKKFAFSFKEDVSNLSIKKILEFYEKIL